MAENSIFQHDSIIENGSNLLLAALFSIYQNVVEQTLLNDLVAIPKPIEELMAQNAALNQSTEYHGKPLLLNVIGDQSFEPGYQKLIKVIPNDANKKLFFELIALNALTKFEQMLPKIEISETKQQKSENQDDEDVDMEQEGVEQFALTSNFEQIQSVKIDFYCILVDFLNFSINVKQDPQYDISFMALSKILLNNSFDTVFKFWTCLETRNEELLKFLKLNDASFYKSTGIKFNNYKLIGRRRPGSVLLQTCNQLVSKFCKLRDDETSDASLLFTKIQLYLRKNFDIDDSLNMDTTFEFNSKVGEHYLAKMGGKSGAVDPFGKFCTLQQWLADPTSNRITKQKESSCLQYQTSIIREFIDKSAKVKEKIEISNSTPNKIDEDIKRFIYTGDLSLVEDVYKQRLIEDKLKLYEDTIGTHATINKAISQDFYNWRKINDKVFRFQVLIQIFVIASFMFGIIDRLKAESHRQITMVLDKYNEYIDFVNEEYSQAKTSTEEKQDEKLTEKMPNNLKPNEKPTYLGYKAIHMSLDDFKRVNSDYYQGLKKQIGSFLQENEKPLYFTINTLVNQGEQLWLINKLTKYTMLSNDFKSKVNIGDLHSYIEESLKEYRKYEPKFSIRFGNRNLTKVLTTQSKLVVEEVDDGAILQKFDDLYEKAKTDTSLKDDFQLSTWQKARVVRKNKQVLSSNNFLKNSISDFKVNEKYTKANMRKSKLEKLKVQIDKLTKEVSEQKQNNDTRAASSNSYISISNEQQDEIMDDLNSENVASPAKVNDLEY